MYLDHFQLSAEPFSLTPDPAFLFKSEVHSEALAALKLGLIERRGLIAMIGEVGTGKTTLLYSLLSSLGPRIRTAYVSNSKLSFDGLLRSALKDFGCPADGATRLDLLESLNAFLLDCDRLGHTAALIVDEAQNLSDEAFEEIRLLSNYETYKRKLLQIVLVGQPELDGKLRQPNLRQVTERVAVRAHVNPLGNAESLAYMEHRLSAVGGSSDIFSKSALKFIAKRSQGIPRRINVLCHNAMLFAYGRNTQRIDKAMVVSASREREGRGLVVFAKRRSGTHRPGPLSRALDSIGTAGLAWGLTGLVIGIFGAFVSMSVLKTTDSATAPSPTVVATTADTTPAAAPAMPDVTRAAVVAKRTPVAVDAARSRPARVHAARTDTADDTQPADTATDADQTVALAANATAIKAVVKATVAKRVPVAVAVANADVAEHVAGIVRSPAGAQTAPAHEDKRAPVPAPKIEPVVAKPAPEQRLASLAPAAAEPRPAIASAADEGLAVPKGATLTEMVLSVYGDYSTTLLDRVRGANPQIDNPDFILAGDRFHFPSTSQTVLSTGGSSRE